MFKLVAHGEVNNLAVHCTTKIAKEMIKYRKAHRLSSCLKSILKIESQFPSFPKPLNNIILVTNLKNMLIVGPTQSCTRVCIYVNSRPTRCNVS